MTYESLFVNAAGRTSRSQFRAALLPLALAAAFYHLLVLGRPAQFAMLVLLFPAIVLHARRLHDMGRSAWLLLAPGALIATAVWLHMFSPGAPYERAVILTALAVSAGFTLWGLLGTGQDGPAERT